MSEFAKKVATARASIIVSLEQALSELGEKFVSLGKALLDEDKDAGNRADHLNSEEGRAVWAGVFGGEVNRLRSVLQEFDRIERDSATAPVRITLYMESDKYKSGSEPNKLENLIGEPALLKRYLAKAGYNLTVEPQNGRCFIIVVSRP